MTKPSASDVARWMRDEIHRERELYQEEAAYHIQETFGEDFVYINENGNLAIDKAVLREFRKLTERSVVWVRSERYWRFRESYDDPNKRVAE
jgi:hypothetical protein